MIIDLNPKAEYVLIDNFLDYQLLTALMPETNISLICTDDGSILKQFEELQKLNIDMKFDCIIMNPPYQKNLHLKILAEAIKHLKDNDSVCVNLSPIVWAGKHNFCQPKGKWRNLLNGKIDSLEFIPHNIANSIFSTGNSIEDLAIISCKYHGQFDILNYGFTSNIEKSIFEKVNIFKKDGNIFTVRQACNGVYGTGNDSHNIQRKKFDVPIYAWHGGKNCKDAVVIKDAAKKVSLAFYFNNDIERTNFLNSLDTTFMNWYYKTYIVPGDYKIVNYMFRMADYSQPWTDERFYKYFNLTADEIKLIEDTIKE